MATRELHINVGGFNAAPTAQSVTLQVNIEAYRSDGSGISETTGITIDLKPGLLYLTAIQANVAIVAAVKDFLEENYSVPTNGWDVTYLLGGFGLLNVL